MALTNNPNKTKSIEKQWNREISRKFKELNDFMLTLPLTSITANVSATQQAQINAFMQQFEERAIGIFLSLPWQNKYQTESYERGITRADQQLKAMLTAKEQLLLPSLNMEAAALVTTAVHANELDFLHKRANKSLTKWIDDLLFDTRSILHEQMGIVSVDDIQNTITDRINVTTSRSRVINVTEISQASQRSVVKEVEAMNAQSDEDIKVEWITVRDERVRALHARWHGTFMSNEQASRNITISPWQCRCGLKPVIESRVPARKKARLKAERNFLVEHQSK